MSVRTTTLPGPRERRILTPGLLSALGYSALYAVWMFAFRLFVLTMITYFSISSRSTGSKFQEISDAYGSNEVVFIGLGALFFVLILRSLNPLSSVATDEIITGHRVKRRFFPGSMHGTVLAIGFALAFLISGLYKYVGFFVQPDEGPLALAGVTIRIAALAILAYSEEFIFRYKILNHFRRDMPDLPASVITALIYCGIKLIQFDLGIMQFTTLFLIAMVLAFRTVVDGDFGRAAGYWAGLLVVFHAVLSLPIFGNDFQGILLLRYQGEELSADTTSRILTGGAGGPLSSAALQLLLFFSVIQLFLKHKKALLKPRAQR